MRDVVYFPPLVSTVLVFVSSLIVLYSFLILQPCSPSSRYGVLVGGVGVTVRSLCCIIDAPYYLSSSLPWLCYKQSLLVKYSLDDFEQRNDSADPELALTP